MTLNFINIITFFNFYVSVMLALFFGLTKHGDKQTNKIISILLLVFTALIFYTFTLSKYASQVFMLYHKILFLVYQLSFLVGPIIYLYARTLKYEKKISRTDLFHSAPFLGFIIYILIYYTKVDSFIMWEHLPFYMVTFAVFVQLIVYLFLIIHLLYRSNKNHSIERKNLNAESRFDTCKNILLSYILFWMICLHGLSIYMLFINQNFCAYSASIWGLSSFIVLNLFIITVIYKPNTLFKKEKYIYSTLSKEVKNKYIDKIEDYLIANRAYLDTELSLAQVSKDVSLDKRKLSQLINETYGVNFRNYINQLRLEHSLLLISDETKQDLRISEIMYNSGFTSRTVFNNLYKEKTGLTPKEFRNKQKRSS